MTKRILSLVLVCILAIPILVVPASATSGVTGTQFDMFTVGLGNLLNSIEENILDAISVGNGWMKEAYEAITSVESTISSWFNTVYRGMANHWTNLQSWISEQTNSIVTFMNSNFESLIEAITELSDEDQAEADWLEQERQEQDAEYNENQDIIQEATKPNVDNITVNRPTNANDTIYINVLKALFVNGANQPVPMFYILSYSFLLALISFGIFGKR